MYHKYIKYKLKYKTLKKSLIGAGKFIVPVTLFHKLIKKVDEEIYFNFIFNDNIKITMIKSCHISEKDPLFTKSFRRINVGGHTHPIFYLEQHKLNCIPPSSKDYSSLIERYFKKNEQLHLVFEPSGIWILQLKTDFIKFLNDNYSYIIKSLKENVDSDSYLISDGFEKLLNNIETESNKLYLELALRNMITKNDYIKKINNLGFDVSFLTWDELLVLNVNINKEIQTEIIEKYHIFDIKNIDELIEIIKNASCDSYI